MWQNAHHARSAERRTEFRPYPPGFQAHIPEPAIRVAKAVSSKGVLHRDLQRGDQGLAECKQGKKGHQGKSRQGYRFKTNLTEGIFIKDLEMKVCK